MTNKIKSYKISYEELSYVLKENKISGTSYSPLDVNTVKAKIISSPKTYDIKEGLTELLKNVASPDAKIILRFGGGKTAPSEQTICITKDHVVGVSFSKKDIVLYRYQNLLSFVDEYILNYVTKNEVVGANLIPPFCSIEEFICILQGIDMYKREYYTGLLNYENQHATGFTLNSYSENLNKAIRANDIRWLLPCFMKIVPNLETKKIKMTNGNVEILIHNGLCKMMKNSDTKELGLYFTNEGKALGLEFESSWLSAFGFEFSKKEDQNIKIISRCFVATTAIANHFVDIINDDKTLTINHQAFHYDQLHQKLTELMKALMM